MENPSNQGAIPNTLVTTIADLSNIIEEIKSHVIESLPMNESTKTPRSEHKLENINEDLRGLKRELDKILKAVSNI